jgi:hypothetical protein
MDRVGVMDDEIFRTSSSLIVLSLAAEELSYLGFSFQVSVACEGIFPINESEFVIT